MSGKGRQIRVAGCVEGLGGRLIIATDGSTNERLSAGGYLSTHGHYGVVAHSYPTRVSGQQRSLVAELRAVCWALEHVLDETVDPVEVACDNPVALGYIQRWKQGHDDLPDNYEALRRHNGETSTLVRLQNLVRYTPDLRFSYVRGHAGEPLNESADALAKLGLRVASGVISEEQARHAAVVHAEQGLAGRRTHDAEPGPQGAVTSEAQAGQ
jgi:ribonuclease HI